MFDIMFGGIFSIAGLGCLALSICLFRGAWRKHATWERAEGTVVGHAESIRDRQKYYRSQVKFVAKSGNPVLLTSSIGSTTRLNRIGDRVKVLYNLDNPDEGVINSFSSLYMPGILFSFFAVGFIAVGVHIISSSTPQP